MLSKAPSAGALGALAGAAIAQRWKNQDPQVMAVLGGTLNAVIVSVTKSIYDANKKKYDTSKAPNAARTQLTKAFSLEGSTANSREFIEELVRTGKVPKFGYHKWEGRDWYGGLRGIRSPDRG